MRILITTPTSPAAPHIHPKTMQSVFAAQMAYRGGNCDWLIRAHDNAFEHAYQAVCHNYNVARLTALDGAYDALLTVEADMIVPEDAIQQLIDTDADVAYGLYIFRQGKQWSAYGRLGLMSARSVSVDADRALAAWGKAVEVGGLGLGCTLIRRHVLEAIEFRLFEGDPNDYLVQRYERKQQQRIDEGRPWHPRIRVDFRKPRYEMMANDWMFALDVQEQGFTQKCNTNVVCGHIDRDGTVLWPDIEADEFFRRAPLGAGDDAHEGKELNNGNIW